MELEAGGAFPPLMGATVPVKSVCMLVVGRWLSTLSMTRYLVLRATRNMCLHAE